MADAALKHGAAPSPGVGVLNQELGETGDADGNYPLASTIRQWFTEAWEHPLWVKYRQEAEEDMGFYIGGDYQWSIGGSTEDLAKLKETKRAAGRSCALASSVGR